MVGLASTYFLSALEEDGFVGDVYASGGEDTLLKGPAAGVPDGGVQCECEGGGVDNDLDFLEVCTGRVEFESRRPV